MKEGLSGVRPMMQVDDGKREWTALAVWKGGKHDGAHGEITVMASDEKEALTLVQREIANDYPEPNRARIVKIRPGSTLDFSDDNVPEDYEPCGECGYDHAYEYAEARREHGKRGTEV